MQRRREALARLKVHPRDDDVNQALIARAERFFEQSIGQRREAVSHHLARFLAVLEAQDPRTIERARAEFGQLLDSLEGETFL
jgi:molecular chaperone HscC